MIIQNPEERAYRELSSGRVPETRKRVLKTIWPSLLKFGGRSDVAPIKSLIVVTLLALLLTKNALAEDAVYTPPAGSRNEKPLWM